MSTGDDKRTEPTQGQMLKAIDRLVREGRAEHVLVDGKPGIRLIKREPGPDDKLVGGEGIEPPTRGV